MSNVITTPSVTGRKATECWVLVTSSGEISSTLNISPDATGAACHHTSGDAIAAVPIPSSNALESLIPAQAQNGIGSKLEHTLTIVGAVAGGVFGILCLTVIFVWLLNRHKKRRLRTEQKRKWATIPGKWEFYNVNTGTTTIAELDVEKETKPGA